MKGNFPPRKPLKFLETRMESRRRPSRSVAVASAGFSQLAEPAGGVDHGHSSSKRTFCAPSQSVLRPSG